MTKWFNVGKIVNTHGIHGEVRVISSTDFPEERYQAGNSLYLFMLKADKPKELIIRTVRQHKNFYLLTFEGHDSINVVEQYKNGILKVSEDQLFELEENEFYYHEIIGCTVLTEAGQEIGKVTEIYSPGANDVWVVKQPDGKEVLIPYIEEVVREINVADKKIIIHEMEGLLD